MSEESRQSPLPADKERAFQFDNRTFQNHLIRIVSIPVFFILVLLVFFHFQNDYIGALGSKKNRFERLRLGLVQIEKYYSDVENGMRGYIMTGDDDFRSLAEESLKKIDPLMDRIFLDLSMDANFATKFRSLLVGHGDFKRYVLTTLSLRESKIRNAQQKAEKQLVHDHQNYSAIKKRVENFRDQVEARHREVSKKLRSTLEITGIIEIVFTLILAFFVVFIMIRQLKKLTASYRSLLSENIKNVEEMRASSKTKDLFLANMSHEIRTPLGAILGFSELIADDPQVKGEMKHHVSFIKRNSEHLLDLIDDLFDISRLSADKLELHFEEVKLAQFIKDIENYFLQKISDKKLDFKVEFGNKIPKAIKTDPTRLKQIVTNLVGNAIKFSPNDSMVKMVVGFSNGRLLVDVIDQGIGIEEKNQKSIFNTFTQADAEHARHFGGAGLGLSISKQLAKALEGELILVSSRKNIGSHFRVSLPCEVMGEDWIESPKSLDQAQVEESEKKRPLKKDYDFSDKRVLLAEDSKENQVLFKIFIEGAKANLTTVDNGSDAVKKAMAEPYDLVLMDIQMPGLDGYEAVNILRGSQYSKKIIALTAHTMKGEKERCLEAGFDDYISKPVSQQSLLQTMERALRS